MKLQTQTKKLSSITCLYLRSVSAVQKHKFIAEVKSVYSFHSNLLYGIRSALC